MTKPTNSIPPSQHYAGMIRLPIPNTDRCIQVYGWGEEAERAAREKLEEVMR